MNRVLIIVAIVGGVLLLVCGGGLAALGIWLESGEIPDTAVMDSTDLEPDAVAEIGAVIGLREGEAIQYYYGYGFSFGEDGSVVTDQRVVSYDGTKGEMIVSDAELDEITAWTVHPSESWLDDTTIGIETPGDELWLWFSSEDEGDQHVIDYLQSRLAVEPTYVVDGEDAPESD